MGRGLLALTSDLGTLNPRNDHPRASKVLPPHAPGLPNCLLMTCAHLPRLERGLVCLLVGLVRLEDWVGLLAGRHATSSSCLTDSPTPSRLSRVGLFGDRTNWKHDHDRATSSIVPYVRTSTRQAGRQPGWHFLSPSFRLLPLSSRTCHTRIFT